MCHVIYSIVSVELLMQIQGAHLGIFLLTKYINTLHAPENKRYIS